MLQIRTILVPTDRSACAERAYAHAADLAARTGAEIRVVHVAAPGGPVDDPTPTTWDDVAAGLTLPAGVAPLTGPIVIEEIEAAGLPAETLLAYAREHDADLVVMGTAGRRGVARFFLGSITEEVVRRADRPVLSVPSHEDRPGGPIVLALDLGDGSREALLHGKALSAARGVALHAVHAVLWPSSPSYLDVIAMPPVATVTAAAQQALDALIADTVGPGVVTAAQIRLGGSVAHSVAAYVRDVGASLVVLSTHQRTGSDRLVMGSIAEETVRMAACPVLTVRPGHHGLLAAGTAAETAAGSDGAASTPAPAGR